MDREAMMREALSNLAYQLVLKNKTSFTITLEIGSGETIEFEWRLTNEDDFGKLVNMMTGKP